MQRTWLIWCAASLWLAWSVGCEPTASPPAVPAPQAPTPAQTQSPASAQPAASVVAHTPSAPAAKTSAVTKAPKDTPAPPAIAPPAATPPVVSRVADEPDQEQLKAHGLRRIAGKHIVLFTDHPSDAEVDALPGWFDQAYPQWCEYFGRPEEKNQPWRVNAYLIVDRERCRAAGVLPADLPPFANGYARGLDLWLYEQPTPYYRRHLLLHEGTHAFMAWAWGDIGPPWYAEGIAELLATHAIEQGQLRLHHFPRSRDETPQLGRIKLIQDAIASGQRLTIGDVMAFGPQAHQRTEAYAWSWALATVVEQRPRWRDAFRAQRQQLRGGDFNPRFAEQIGTELPELRDAWAVFCTELTHHYDLDRAAIVFAPGKPLTQETRSVRVAADRGWQSSGIKLVRGVRYQLSASGNCELARTSDGTWISEPPGVSIRYYRGRPLGRLLAVLRPDTNDMQAASPFLAPVDIGAQSVLTPEADATLYLRVNDSPAELHDNQGEYQVQIAVQR